MSAKKIALVFFVLYMLPLSTKAQFTFGFSNEIGLVTGPLLFQSDFGIRTNFNTNTSNMGLGVGIVHYINFAYRADCNCYSRDHYFNDHFKIRNEIEYHFTYLSHKGELTEKDSDEGRDLRDHKGTSSVFEIGSQLEFFPLNIRDFQSGAFKIAPFISVGAHYVYFDPSYSSVQDVPGATPEDIYFNAFLVGDCELGGLDSSSRSTFAMTGSIGFRYKLTMLSDLMIELRHHKYLSNWVDGLNPDVALYPSNKYDDSITSLMVGYVYYLDF